MARRPPGIGRQAWASRALARRSTPSAASAWECCRTQAPSPRRPAALHAAGGP
eukprot:CAMPEP_0198576636 /NCGR_PEP_ID=MMETSP1462-20131121/117863_1 /TAXON_ID=1333877 /ORGANISM="Brandtodinium nutriculum, Strain RCC3387" /LENGTH=52 /DNA_ID=CAMNT_0044307903 /DNA_START=61 /DNA_END=215 /DNA_ORIENTATION=-